MKRTIISLTAAALLASGLGLQASADTLSPALKNATKATAPTLNTGIPKPKVLLALKCTVSGTPVEFPNDIAVWATNASIPAGTTVAWSVPGTVLNGTATLPAVAKGKAHYISNAIPGGLVAGTPCSAKMN